jgi:drug/metabolite transporter (DMT)-like permease
LVGLLMQAAYLGGVFWAVRHGLPAGVAGLLGGIQPLLTAMLARPLLGEIVGKRRWFGVAMGFAGVALVLSPGLGTASGIAPVPLLVCSLGVIGLTFGTIRQKSLPAGADLRCNAAIQFLAAAIATIPLAILTEDPALDFGMSVWPIDVWLGLAWAVFGLSFGAISLLLLMIRRGAVSAVASMFYLVPPVAALIAFAMFGERLVAVQIVGMVLAAIGVAIASRAQPTR